MNFASKRKRDDTESDAKKIKNLVENEQYTNSNEWPVYSHPQGGLVKITPWGCLRQYTNPQTGELITKFEDSSFADYSFKPTQTYDTMPSTPQSLYQSLSAPPSAAHPGQDHQDHQMSSPIRVSPSSEAETYVVQGYQAETPPHQDQFEQEHENYFGME